MRHTRGWGRGPEGLLADRVAICTACPLPRPSPASGRGENYSGRFNRALDTYFNNISGNHSENAGTNVTSISAASNAP